MLQAGVEGLKGGVASIQAGHADLREKIERLTDALNKDLVGKTDHEKLAKLVAQHETQIQRATGLATGVGTVAATAGSILTALGMSIAKKLEYL